MILLLFLKLFYSLLIIIKNDNNAFFDVPAPPISLCYKLSIGYLRETPNNYEYQSVNLINIFILLYIL
uniref:Uncharacterized protein n=1 Tax=Pararge aegeria TaxID=116150 RepID=S4PT21_9NEOP